MADEGSPDEEDIRRSDRDYIAPDSTTESEYRQDLRDAGFPDDSIDAFVDRMVSESDISLDDGGLTTREDIESAVSDIGSDSPTGRVDQVVDSVAKQEAAPSESNLRKARAQVAQNVDEEGVVRSDPSLDPLAGDEGREIGAVSEVTENTGGRGGGLTETVEKTGRSTGTLYYEDSSGSRYPVAEVDI